MERNRPTDGHVAAEAADWFAQFQDRSGRSIDPAAFAEWLTRSPAHVEEFLEIAAVWSAVGSESSRSYNVSDLIAAARAERAQDKVVQLPATRSAGQADSRRISRRGVRRARVGLAAALLVGLALWTAFVFSLHGTEYVTAVGEQRSVTLSDGSVVFLNTDSEVRVQFDKSRRTIQLVRGEARFRVAANPQRPFVVTTPDATIRALGTIFNVAMDPEGTQVAVIEGRVELRQDAADDIASAPDSVETPARNGVARDRKRHMRLELAAGQRAATTPQGIEPEVGQTIESANAWTQRRLVFRDKTLAEVIGQFNRYHRQKLVIDDPGLAGLRISGTFDTSDPESLVTYLGTVESVRVRTPADGTVHLSQPRP